MIAEDSVEVLDVDGKHEDELDDELKELYMQIEFEEMEKELIKAEKEKSRIEQEFKDKYESKSNVAVMLAACLIALFSVHLHFFPLIPSQFHLWDGLIWGVLFGISISFA